MSQNSTKLAHSSALITHIYPIMFPWVAYDKLNFMYLSTQMS